ncbi:hypothetical protein C0995_013975 [Termitomyces sp. Mi166|nr:hypothetical protein C0995_013975 [Termitomyces sp. Mi166\
MLVEAVKDSPRDGWPLITAAKRYWLPELTGNADDPDALTLVLLHSTSFHKETWEPSLEKLLTLSAQPGSKVKIREAWSLDCPNHGEAGHLNEPVLNDRAFRNNFTCEKYAKAVHRFLSDAPYHSAGINFRARNLVGIGHSLGGNAIPAGPTHLNKLRYILVRGAHERRDVWPDRERAMIALKRRERTAKWDRRILDLFVKYAVVPHPGSYEKETPYIGVTLACTRDQEAAMYRDADGPTKPVEDLKKAPARVHAAILDPKYGGVYASVRKVKGVGHLIPQEAPDRLAVIMYEALSGNSSTSVKSKL